MLNLVNAMAVKKPKMKRIENKKGIFYLNTVMKNIQICCFYQNETNWYKGFKNKYVLINITNEFFTKLFFHKFIYNKVMFSYF